MTSLSRTCCTSANRAILRPNHQGGLVATGQFRPTQLNFRRPASNLAARSSSTTTPLRSLDSSPPLVSSSLSTYYHHHHRCSTNFIPSHYDHYSRRYFTNESEYHKIADETLEDLQDAVETALEDVVMDDTTNDRFELVFASGVLTMTFPPHGTWVLNKQTPNRQIWWSSPLSGPRRYEYEDGEWVYTRDDSHSMTLQQALKEEIREIYGVELEID